MPENNGENKFMVEVKCEKTMSEADWGKINCLVNHVLDIAEKGRYSDVAAYLVKTSEVVDVGQK
jgi:hypothetical protein